ncbi:hypothetical protein GW17_00022782 [Ensete ventricosum]|nr:hypothetical protein GW17_00022782 [Ensete ventricosum]
MLRVRTSYLNSASVAGDKLPSNEYGMIARGARLSVDVYRPIAKEARFYFIKVSLKQGIRNAANKSGSEDKGNCFLTSKDIFFTARSYQLYLYQLNVIDPYCESTTGYANTAELILSVSPLAEKVLPRLIKRNSYSSITIDS